MAMTALMKREFVTQLRQRRVLLLLLVLCVCVGCCVVFNWAGYSATLRTTARSAREILMLIVLFVAGGMVVCIPGVAATTLVGEREQNTWDMLSTSLLGPWRIILGKMVYSIGTYALLVIGIAPFASSIFFMVGIDLYSTLYTWYILFLGMITYASLGLLASAYQRTTVRAVLHSYFYVAINLGLGYLVICLVYGMFVVWIDPSISRFSQLGGSVLMDVPESLFAMKVFFNSLAAFVQGANTGFGQMVLAHTAIQLSTIVIALGLTYRRINRPVRPMVQKNAKRPKRSKKTKRVRRLFSPPDGFEPTPDTSNPIQFREQRFSLNFTTGARCLIGANALFLPMILSYCHWRLDMPMVLVMVYALIVNLIQMSFFALLGMATMFTKEDELKNMDMLKVTLLTPKALVWGKVSAGMYMVNRLAIINGMMMVWFMIPVLYDHYEGSRWSYIESLFIMFAGSVSLWMCGMICVVLGGLASVLSKKTASAIVLGLVLVFMVYFGNIGIIVMIIENMNRVYTWDNFMINHLALVTSPVVGFLMIIDQKPFEDNMFPYWLFHVAVFSVKICIIYWLTYNHFRKHRYSKPKH